MTDRFSAEMHAQKGERMYPSLKLCQSQNILDSEGMNFAEN